MRMSDWSSDVGSADLEGTAMRIKHTFRLPAELSGRLADYAARKRVAQTQIVEAALLSFLSPDGSERPEAAIGRRLDRLSRQSDRLEHHVAISNEAMALFVRFWLTTTPPLPDTALAAAQASGRERYRGFRSEEHTSALQSLMRNP